MDLKETQNLDENAKKKKPKKGFWRRLFRVLLIILLIPILCSFLLQIPAVQNWTVDRLASYFEKKLETKVEIDQVRLNIFDGLDIQKFYVEDHSGDTLIFSENFKVGLTKNLFSVFNKELSMSTILMENAVVKISKTTEDGKSNLIRIVDKLNDQEGKKENKKGSSWSTGLQRLEFKQIRFVFDDQTSGNNHRVFADEGFIQLGDSDDYHTIIDELYLLNPIIRITKDNSTIEVETMNVKEEDVEVQEVSSTEDSISSLLIKSLKIKDGVFSYNDLKEKERYLNESILDYNHFEIIDFQFDANEINYSSDFKLKLVLDNMSFKDNKDFIVEAFKADTFSLTDREISLEGLRFKTDQSDIREYLSFKYRSFGDFKNFQNKIYMKADLKGTELSFNDLLHFVPELNGNPFFEKNRAKHAKIDGSFRGRVSNLSGRNMTIGISNEIAFKGSFNTRNLSGPEQALLNLKVDALETNMEKLSRIIPNFNPTSNFYRLGNISFNGRFDGYFDDFVAFGTLRSDIGSAGMDMRLDLKNGKEFANYSGEIRLDDFDLQKWTLDDNLGKISAFGEIKEGRGLDIKTAFADLNAEVKHFEYKGYLYENFIMDGQLEENNFAGNFSIQDENIDLEFDGNIILNDSMPVADFKSKIRTLDLQKLNIVNKALTISGDIDINIQGKSISDFSGNGLFRNVEINARDTSYIFDSLSLRSELTIDNKRRVEVVSDIADMWLVGNFNLKDVPQDIKRVLKENYPYHTRNISPASTINSKNQFEYQIELKETKNLLDFAKLNGLKVTGLNLKGSFDGTKDLITTKGFIKKAEYNNDRFHETYISLNSNKNNGELSLALDSLFVSGKKYKPTRLDLVAEGDRLIVDFATTDIIDSVQSISFRSEIIPHEKGYEFHFTDKDINILGNKWKFSHFNSLVLGNRYLNLEDFEISDGSSTIILRDVNEKGLALNMTNFDFLLVNGLIDYDNIDFGGRGELGLVISDLYDKRDINLSLDMPMLYLNEDPFGHLFVDVVKKEDGPYDAAVFIKEKEIDLWLEGKYFDKKDSLDAKLIAENTPFNIMEYIISEGISQTQGSADVEVKINGSINDLNLDGQALFKDCGVRIDYLGTYYAFDQQVMSISEDYLGFENQIMTDILGNEATVNGGLRHKLLTDFQMEVDMSSNDIIALNTTKADNPLYYGFGKGQMDVQFRGPFNKADIFVNATTGPGTKFSIPAEYSFVENEESFIQFTDFDQIDLESEKDDEHYKIEGLNVEMDLTVTEDATMEIIFIEKLGDIVRGQGNGDLQVKVKRTGEFSVYGDYEVERGEYLFTSLNIVAKPFTVRKGGLITWTGDPINAQLNIEAEYRDLRTNLSVFLEEYLLTATDQIQAEASRRTNVDLSLNLTGTLYEPIFEFDLDFPDLETGELKSYVDSKLRTLRTDKNGLNAQVAGLIVWKTFLPYNNPLGGDIFNANTLVQSSTSTLSEFVSNQFSILLSELINEALADNKFISSIDFEFGLNQNADLFAQTNDVSLLDVFDPDEIQLAINPRFKFFDEKLSARVGGNYVRNSISIPENSIIPDFAIEYYITDDRRLKVRLYGRYDFDQIAINQRKQRYGLGLSWRHEFGNINEFRKGIEEAARREQEEEDGPSQ